MIHRIINPELPEPDPEAMATSPLHLQLDWDAYFDLFKTVHGEPVRWRGNLLFADGWRYSARSKEGPEYPPPTDPHELHMLQTSYWLTRLNLVRAERDFYRDLVTNLRALQRTHSQPLQQKVIAYDEEKGTRRLASQTIDIDGMEHGRLAWLEQDLLDCQAQLTLLERSSPT